ncbi:deoxyribonuclease V [Geoalkalibacter halelectricus]|uniref:deoxyribonuclease V n=1 Tax=Geoalkalibacter halelectricus TaxID=2847045 RepID=UPI003D22824C
MDFPALHAWDPSPREAVALQRRLAAQVVVADRLPARIKRVAGVDVSYEKHGRIFFAAVSVLSFPDLEPLAEASARGRSEFPYIPGLLSFRELPLVLQAFQRLVQAPDVILVDGQGIAHPRRLGLASHLGLWLGVPTIGCAKSRLCGEHAAPGTEKGAATPLCDGEEIIGTVLTTRTGTKPLYVSPGHLVDQRRAVEITLACCRRFRQPEPTRRAHHLSNQLRRSTPTPPEDR